jgi:hypothetical protein
MAEYISFQPSDFFSTTLYTGTGAEQTISGVGLQPDVTWMKNRDDTEYHYIFDTVRGATKELYPNDTLAQGTNANALTSWNSDGFVVGSDDGVNKNTDAYASWNWKAGTTSGLSGGTITPSAYSINTTSGFGVYAFTGNGVAGATIAHGLGTKPGLIIVKELGTAGTWIVQHQSLGATKCIFLNTTSGQDDDVTRWNDTEPTSTLFSLGSDGEVNGNTQTYIAYVWAGVKGYSKFSSFIGNGNADGAFVYTGFRPAFVIIKRYNTSGNWTLWDDKRLGYNVANNELQPNLNAVEDTSSHRVDLLSNGFKLRNSSPSVNDGSYIYMAFAEFPIVSSNDVPGLGR